MLADGISFASVDADAPLLADALAAVNRGDTSASHALVAAVAADEVLWVPVTDDGRHPLATTVDGEGILSAFTSVEQAQWGHPARPPLIEVPVSEVIGWATRSRTPLHLDFASEGAVVLAPERAQDLLAGRPVPADAVAGGAAYRRPGPPAPVPASLIPPPPTEPPEAGIVAYGGGWDAVETVLEEPLDPETAQARHNSGVPYAAFRTMPDGRRIVLRFGPRAVVVEALDVAGRPTGRLTWRHFAEGLFLEEVATTVFGPTGTSHPKLEVVSLARVDGVIRTWTRSDDGLDEIEDRYIPSTTEHWTAPPPFGHHRRLLDPLG